MVNLHGGHVQAHSDGPGRGSCFSVVLPLNADKQIAGAGRLETDVALASGSALRILIVDDNRDAAESLDIVLACVGHMVQVEDSSMAALRRVQQKGFDVCLLDIGLPDLDGHQLVGRLRAAPLVSGAAMNAASGYGQPQDMAASGRAGFSRHLVKPVDISQLLALIDEVAHSLGDGRRLE